MSQDTFPTVGILGGGQLGRMLALAGIRMGLTIRSISPAQEGPMIGLGEEVIGDWNDPEIMAAFVSGCTVVTAESEWAPVEVAEQVVSAGTAIRPAFETIRLIRDKGLQKSILADAGLPVPRFALCTSFDKAVQCARNLGFPLLAKKRRGSYDGYGNMTVQEEHQLESAWTRLADDDGLMLEAWVPFKRELAVMIARRPGGEHVVYPVAWTEQRDHRCHSVVVPAPVPESVAERARSVSLQAVEAVKGVGIVAVELFELEDGSILINELAPRPHNTGHYSIEACYASQFENHLRAVLDWPLGSPDLRASCAVMVNVLGKRNGPVRTDGFMEAVSNPDVSVHIYGKKETKPRRKMGHVTITGSDAGEILARAEKAAESILL